MKNVIIIGKGPAGVSAALYTARAGLDTTIIANGIGSLEKAHEIQNYYGFGEPISGKALALQGVEGAKKVGVKFVEEEVVGISFGEKLTVDTNLGHYPADYVVIATGTSRNTPNIPNLKKLEGGGVSYCAICDAFFYRKRAVAVLGNGEFALHEMNDLLNVTDNVTILTNGEEPAVMFPENVKVIKTKIKELKGDEYLEGAVFEDGSEIPLDGLFVALGVAGSTAFAKKIGAQISDNKIVVNENMQTTVPGLYAAGDCTGGLLQVSKAVCEGAIAGNTIAKESRK